MNATSTTAAPRRAHPERPKRSSLIVLLPLAACGVDAATANREPDRMESTLANDDYPSGRDRRESGLVTGHERYFSVGLTGRGGEDANGAADEV